jgi:hypothetical protein
MQALFNLMLALLRHGLAFFRSRSEQAIVELALRQQLATYGQIRSKPKLTPLDRAFWIALFRFWPPLSHSSVDEGLQMSIDDRHRLRAPI